MNNEENWCQRGPFLGNEGPLETKDKDGLGDEALIGLGIRGRLLRMKCCAGFRDTAHLVD